MDLDTHVAMDATSLVIAVLTLAAGAVGFVFAIYRQLASLENDRKREREEFNRLAERAAALEAFVKAAPAQHASVQDALKALAEKHEIAAGKFAAIDKQMEWIFSAPEIKYRQTGQDGKPVERV